MSFHRNKGRVHKVQEVRMRISLKIGAIFNVAIIWKLKSNAGTRMILTIVIQCCNVNWRGRGGEGAFAPFEEIEMRNLCLCHVFIVKAPFSSATSTGLRG